MYEFKVGDEVILNPRLKVGEKYGDLQLFDGMIFEGIKTIERVEKNFEIEGFYYSPEMLLPVPVFKEGDVVTVRPDFSRDHSHFGLDDNKEMLSLRGKQATIRKICEGNYTPEKTGEDGCSYRVEGNSYTWSSNSFIINNLTQSKDENRLQGKEPVITGGSKFKGCRICCRKNKAAITVGHLSYKRIS